MSRIVTFYSYKGGVGRTFALANIAVLLARRGKRVLMMDWDLEAPGLNHYFHAYLPEASLKGGLIHLLHQATESAEVQWEPAVTELMIPGSGSISLIYSGDQSPDYIAQVQSFSWSNFFERKQGGNVLERWRTEWKSEFDFVLIDSRTGITDTGGVCTILLPDILVFVFSANTQSFERGKRVALGVQEARRNLSVPRPPAAILPLPGRFDGRDEVDEAQRWLDRFAKELKPFYDDWLPTRFQPRQMIEITKVPYITKFSFGEPLPVISQGVTDPDSPGFYLENIARLIASDFHDAARMLAPELYDASGSTDERGRRLQVAPTRLRHGARHFLAREKEMAALDQVWNDPAKRVLTILAWGGEGKTSLVAEWMARKSATNWPDCERVFDWSFSNDDQAEENSSSGDDFIQAALEFFGDAAYGAGPATPWDKGARLAQLVAQRRSLLVLDSLDALLQPPGPLAGQLRNPAFTALLRGLCQRNPGLCIITSRDRLADLAPFRDSVAPEWELPALSASASIELLKSLGVHGTPDEFERLANDLGGHPLTLNLLGNYLVKAHQGDIRKRDRVRFEDADARMLGGRGFKMVAAYENWLDQGGEEGARALAVLRLLALFDRPADAGCLKALCAEPVIPELTEPLVGLSENNWNLALSFLADSGLATLKDNRSIIDTHLIVRDYFAKQLRETNPTAWRSSHRRLYEHLKGRAEYQPDTLEGLQPLYHAVTHGCHAGMYQKACDEVFFSRIRRGNERFSWSKLGAFEADLRALACFFPEPWRSPSNLLAESDQAWLLNEAAFSLRALGRLAEALEPVQAGLDLRTRQANWKEAAIASGNLSELHSAMGELPAAISEAEQAVGFAGRSGDVFQRQNTRLILAHTLHQIGRPGDALTRFREAEAMQMKDPQDYSLSYWSVSFRYCDWLLADAERAAWQRFASRDTTQSASNARHIATCRDVKERSNQALKNATHREMGLLDVALNRLTLGHATLCEAILAGSGYRGWSTAYEAAHQLFATALDGLRSSGSHDEIPRGLLSLACLRSIEGDASGARMDLDEAWSIAERGPMRLFMADIHLHRARCFRDKGELSRAGALIRSLGYGRRTEELERAEADSSGW